MKLRDVRLDDVELYVRMRCDPVMMTHLWGPQPRDGIEAKVRSDVESVERGEAWICVIVPDEADPSTAAGSVVIWAHGDEPLSEMGWMVLPEFQGRGIGTEATRMLLERARVEARWGRIHAFPAVTNEASNRICQSVGFQLVGEEHLTRNGVNLLTNRWVIDPPYGALKSRGLKEMLRSVKISELSKLRRKPDE